MEHVGEVGEVPPRFNKVLGGFLPILGETRRAEEVGVVEGVEDGAEARIGLEGAGLKVGGGGGGSGSGRGNNPDEKAR